MSETEPPKCRHCGNERDDHTPIDGELVCNYSYLTTFDPGMTDSQRIHKAIELAVRHGSNDGGHHKAWVIDQMVRVLAGERYTQVVRTACHGDDGPNTYDWDEGIPP